MMRFYSVHRTPTEGTHLHRCFTATGRTVAQCLAQLRAHRAAMAPHNGPAPLFFDWGPGDTETRRLDKVTAEAFQ